MEFVFFAFLALVVALIIFGILGSAKRRKELSAWAVSKGWRFSSSSDYGFDERFPGFECLRQGSDRYSHNLTEGSLAGIPLLAFDYHYETTSTDSKGRRQTHHHNFSATILQSRVPLKPLFIRPEGFFDKITEFFGFDDIDFESAEFSRKFYVKAADKRWAYDVIHQRTMEFLLSMPHYTIEFSRSYMIAYRGSTFSIGEFESALELLKGIQDRLPEYVVKQQQGAS
ncbi:MAG: hypothetical protein HY717_00520 [Planctomycetes bacterium]|nr:hypothetical protein [Planctomycetota bacterium]